MDDNGNDLVRSLFTVPSVLNRDVSFCLVVSSALGGRVSGIHRLYPHA